MELHCPLLQPIGIPEIRRWLKILCHGCSRPIVGPAKYSKLPPRARFSEAAGATTEGKVCSYRDCKKVHPKIIQEKEDNFTLLVQQSWQHAAHEAVPYSIAQIFDRVRDEDVLLLGKSLENHPRKLVMSKCIQIPPITIRHQCAAPRNTLAAPRNNDINGMLQHLITRNKAIKQDLIVRGEIDQDLDKTITNFQQFYYDLIQGSTAVSSVGSTGKRTLIAGSKPVMSFLKMQSRKQGRIRSNLLERRSPTSVDRPSPETAALHGEPSDSAFVRNAHAARVRARSGVQHGLPHDVLPEWTQAVSGLLQTVQAQRRQAVQDGEPAQATSRSRWATSSSATSSRATCASSIGNHPWRSAPWVAIAW